MQVTKIRSSDTVSADDRDPQAIAALEQRIDQVIATGSISRKERSAILALIYADGAVTARECELYRRLQECIWRGELYIE